MRNKQIIPKRLIVVIFAIVSICVFSTESGAPNGDYGDGSGSRGKIESYGTLRISYPNITTNVLKTAEGTAMRTSILSYSVEYYSKPSAKERKDDDKIDLRPIFSLEDANGFLPEDFRAFTLVVDENGNGKIDEGENDTIGGSAVLEKVKVNKETGELVSALIVFEERHRLEYKEVVYLILVADIINLEEKDSFVVCRNIYRGEHVDYVLPSGKKDVNAWGGASAKHHVGNRPPELDTYGAGAVSSDYKNMEGSIYTFRVRFKDPDGDASKGVYLHLDKGDGFKKYRLKSAREYGEITWIYGENYTISMKLMFNPNGIKYRFSASDGKLSAEGEPTKEQTVAVLPWVLTNEKYVSIENTQVLPGQKIKILASFIANVDAKVEWKHSEGKTYDDYAVVKIIEGKKEPIRGLAGFMIHLLTLYIVPTPDFGKKSISSIEFPFSVNKKRGEGVKMFRHKGVLQMPDIGLEIVPAIANVKISQKEVMLGDKIKYSLNLDVFRGAIVEQRTVLPTEPFRKISDVEIKVIELDKLKQEIYQMDTWSFSLPFEVNKKTGERYYAFPQFKLKAVYKKEKYDINVAGAKVRFVPPLSDEELRAPNLPVEIVGPLPVDEKKLFWRSKAPIVTGTGTLVLVFLYYIIGFFVFSKKDKKTNIKEKRKNLAECLDGLETNLKYLSLIADSKKQDEVKKYGELCFTSLQKFLNFFVTDSNVDMRTKDCEYIANFVDKLPAESNPFAGVAGQKVMFQFKDLMTLLWWIIYDSDITDENISKCKKNALFIAKYLNQNKKKIIKMIK